MSAAFTPGPWKAVQFGGLQIGAGDGYAIATMWDGKAAQSKTDAHLIAAAPDLYTAAEDALSGWRYIRQQHGDLPGVGWDRVEAALAAALAKARGEA